MKDLKHTARSSHIPPLASCDASGDKLGETLERIIQKPGISEIKSIIYEFKLAEPEFRIGLSVKPEPDPRLALTA